MDGDELVTTGEQAPDWRADLSDELRAAPALQDIGDVAALAQTYVDQTAYLGNAIRPPGPDASDDQKKAFYAKVQEHAGEALVPRPDPEDKESLDAFMTAIGRPSEAAGYAAPAIDNFDDGAFDDAREVFHKAGLTNAQAQAIAEYQHGQASTEYAETLADRKEQHAGLQREWGMTYQPRLDAVVAWLVREKAPEGIGETIGTMPVDQVKFLHSVMTRLGVGEGDMHHQEGGAEPGVMPPAEALERANEIMTRLAGMHPADPSYKGLIDKRLEYIKMANPGAEQSLSNLRAGSDPSQMTG